MLVDEYDKAVNSLLAEYLGEDKTKEKEKFIKDVTNLISNTICSPIAKTNEYVEKLILVGIFDTTHKEFGSGCNNVVHYGITDSKFSEYFGFFEHEINTMIVNITKEIDMKSNIGSNWSHVLSNITTWYDGYAVPSDDKKKSYNPTSTMKHLNSAYTSNHSDGFNPKPYWAETGADNTLLKRLFVKEKCLNSTLMTKFNDISENGFYELNFNPQISLFKYDWFIDIDNSGFFSYLLLNSGYLTISDKWKGANSSSIALRIPNKELREEFINNIIPNDESGCKEVLEGLSQYKRTEIESKSPKIVSAILSRNDTALQKELNSALTNGMSCQPHGIQFNYLELAALSGTNEAFSLLSDKCKNSKALLSNLNKVHNINIADFAKISNNTDVLSLLHNRSEFESINKPSFFYNYFLYYYCNYAYGTASAIVAGGLAAGGAAINMGFLDRFQQPQPAQQLQPGQINTLKFWGWFAMAGVIKPVADAALWHLDSCRDSDVKKYNSIDISNLNKFNRFEQFEKYLLENSDAYLVINDNCGNSGQKLISKNFEIFEAYHLVNEQHTPELTFTLCKESKEDL